MGWNGVFCSSIGTLVTISTGALVSTTGTLEIGDGLSVSIGTEALCYGLSASI